MKYFSAFLILGIFSVAFSWFIFTLYQFAKGITGQIVYFTDVPGSVGLGFRTAAGLIALIMVLFAICGKELSSSETLISLRWIILFEAVYWLVLFPSALWGFYFEGGFGYTREVIIASTGLPCLVESTILPAFLLLLFAKLKPDKPYAEKAKWVLTTGTLYIFIFWFNYTMQWTAEILRTGTGFVLNYSVNAFAFALTVIGLLLIAIYAANYTRKFMEKPDNADIKQLGAIITAFGLYFDINLLLWLIYGKPGGWNLWHTFFIYHNMDLWMATLPLVGLPLLFMPSRQPNSL
ncbi:MAG: hypothetical protein RMK50_06685 [Nitrososphaerota archaeon]|nr:hypothetical protein [Candidatus Bathyarchaeota archaeon]MDW8194487.1 hypothetical protein [Nitrososphaerota archaeon]